MLNLEHSSTNKEMTFRPEVLVSVSDEIRNGLIDEVHMEGLIMNKCSGQDIHLSNAFMVVTEKKSGSLLEKYYKIQNKVFFKAFSAICQYETFCTSEQCKINDATAAEFLIEKEIGAQSEYKGLQSIIPVYNSSKTRQGIRYICPYTKLDEIAFPVKLFDRSLGVLIVGQFTVPEHKEALEKYIKTTISKKTGEGGCGFNSACMLDNIKEEKDLQQLIEKICDTVDDIEKGLIDSYEERQAQYVLEKSNELIKNLKKSIQEVDSPSLSLKLVYPAIICAEQYKAIGRYVREQLEILCHTIGAKKYEIFVPTFENLTENGYDYIRNEHLQFCFAAWNRREERDGIYCTEPKNYIEGIEEEFDILLVADALTYPIALVLRCEDFLTDMGEMEKELLKQTVCKIFSKFAEFAQMAGMEAKSDYYRVFLDSYMSIQRHELGQSNAGYQMLIEEFRKHRNLLQEKIMELKIDSKAESYIQDYLKQCDNFIRDSDAYLHTTMIRIQSSRYLIDFSHMAKSYFYPYDAFLFKWSIIYGKMAKKNNLKFQFPKIASWDFNRPRMYGDPLMIEQIAYNLTNNAIKYALPGTMVSLDCRLNASKTHYEMVAENYGQSLKDSSDVDTIFDYGIRGSNEQKEGSGLGLFLSRQIARAHGGDIDCKIEKLSEYNWTLIPLYLNFYETKKYKRFCNDESLYKILKAEWEKRKDEILDCIKLKIPNNEFTPQYVHQNIRKGTAKFEFTFWLPYDGQ